MRTAKVLMLLVLLAVFHISGSRAADNAVQAIADDAKYENALEKAIQPGQASVQPNEADKLTHEFKLGQEKNRMMFAYLVAAMGIAYLVIILWFLARTREASAVHMVTASGLVLVILGTILVLLIADTEAQLTAAMGIMGAFAGYFVRMIQEQRRPEEQ